MHNDLVMDDRLIELGHHSVGMVLNLSRNLISHERAFRIPPQQDLIVRFIPHQRQRIELAIERTLLIDTTG